jgi:hypothetical protein
VNTQEIFDHVAGHLLTQLEKSVCNALSVTCMYRSDSGLMCAAGCLISDEEYSSIFEGVSWSDLVKHGAVQTFGAEGDLLVCDLQFMHDAREPMEWPDLLRAIAATHHLRCEF